MTSASAPPDAGSLALTILRIVANVDILETARSNHILTSVPSGYVIEPDLAALQAVLHYIKVTDVAADGHCFYRAAARAMLGIDQEWRFSELRALTATMLDTEPCNATDEGAFVDEWHNQAFPRRIVPLPGYPSRTVRFVDGTMRGFSDVFLSNIEAWVSGAHSPEGVDVIARLRNIFGIDAQQCPTAALHARQVYIRSPDGVFPESGRVSWAEQTEIVALQYKLQVTFACFVACRNQQTNDLCAAMFPADMSSDIGLEASKIVPVGFIGYHYVSIDEVQQDDTNGDDDDEDGDGGDGNDDNGGDNGQNDNDHVRRGPIVPELPEMIATLDEVRAAIRELKTNEFPELVIVSSDIRRVRVVCKGEPLNDAGKQTVCIQYSYDRTAGAYFLRVNLLHVCGSAGARSPFERRTPTELLNEINGLDMAKGVNTSNVKAMLAGRGIIVSQSKAQRIAALALDRLYGTLEENYATLRSYLQEYGKQAGTTFYSHIDGSALGDFRAVFVVPPYAKQFTRYSVRMIMSDACHSVRRSGGGLWIVTAVPLVGVAFRKGALSSTIVVALSFHNCTESNDAWNYHFSHMLAAGLFSHNGKMLVATDGRVGVPGVIEGQVSPTSGSARKMFHHVRDLMHIARNIAAHRQTNNVAASWSVIVSLLRPIAMAKSPNEMQSLVNDLMRAQHRSGIDLQIRQHLQRFIVNNMLGTTDVDQRISRSSWLMCYADAPRFGLVTTNNVESFMAAFLRIGARGAPIRAALATVLQYCNDTYVRVQETLGLVPDTPPNPAVEIKMVRRELRPMYGSMGEQFVNASRIARQYRVAMAIDNSGGNVQLPNGSSFAVSITNGKCSCGWPATMGVPCSHAVTVANRAGGNALQRFIAPGLLYEDLKAAMNYTVQPVSIDVSQLPKDNLRKGPVLGAEQVRRQQQSASTRGRPRSEKRRPSAGENQPQTCRTCHQPNHNSRSCSRQQPQGQ